MGNIDFIKFAGGLGIFLFAMSYLENSIKKLSTGTLKKIIKNYTSNSVKAVLSGLILTTILQSSSALSLIILAFTGAGLLPLKSAIGLILGANIGSTTTGWIVAILGFGFNIENFALPLIASGIFISSLLNKDNIYSKIFSVISGSGFLFLGLSFMKLSFLNIDNNFMLIKGGEHNLWIYFLSSMFFTAIIQASSATVAIVLSALNAEILSFDRAATMVIGADIGTTVTILWGSIGGNMVKKKVAISQVGFNLFTGIIALIALPYLIRFTNLIFSIEENSIMALVLFHSTFNILGVLIFIPLINPTSELLSRIIKEKIISLSIYINNVTPEIPETALLALKREIKRLFMYILIHNLNVLEIDEEGILKEDKINENKLMINKNINHQYQNLKKLQSEITTFATQIQTGEISVREINELEKQMHGLRLMVHSAKSLKDIKHNFENFILDDSVFLKNQYQNFQKRIAENYLEIIKIMDVDKYEISEITDKIIDILNDIKKEDKRMLAEISSALTKKEIADIAVSDIVLANRAFVQSNRQILLSLKELLLDMEGDEIFNRKIQSRTEFLEIEDD